MLKKILTVVAILMLVVGIGLVAFPPISNFIGTQISNGEADGFDTRVEEAEDGSFEQAVKDGKVDKEGYKVDKDGKRTSKQPVVFKVDLDRLFKDSIAYNKKLESSQYEMLRNDTYSQAAVNLEDYGITDGIYGYVTAETINMRLPIYLGANSSNMSYGAAHMSATSLPIGGKNANAVLAGHTGYIGRIFLTTSATSKSVTGFQSQIIGIHSITRSLKPKSISRANQVTAICKRTEICSRCLPA